MGQQSTYNMPQTNNNLQYNASQSVAYNDHNYNNGNGVQSSVQYNNGNNVQYNNSNGNGMDSSLPPNIEDMDGLVNFVNGKSPQKNEQQMEELHDPNDALWSML